MQCTDPGCICPALSGVYWQSDTKTIRTDCNDLSSGIDMRYLANGQSINYVNADSVCIHYDQCQASPQLIKSIRTINCPNDTVVCYCTDSSGKPDSSYYLQSVQSQLKGCIKQYCISSSIGRLLSNTGICVNKCPQDYISLQVSDTLQRCTEKTLCDGSATLIESMTKYQNTCVSNCGKRRTLNNRCMTCQQDNPATPFLLQNGSCAGSCVTNNFIFDVDNLMCIDSLSGCSQLVRVQKVSNIIIRYCSNTCGSSINYVKSDEFGFTTNQCLETQTGCESNQQYSSVFNGIPLVVCVIKLCDSGFKAPADDKCVPDCYGYRYTLEVSASLTECYNECPTSNPANYNSKCIQNCQSVDSSMVMSPVTHQCLTGAIHSDFYLNYDQLMGCLFGIIGAAVLICVVLAVVFLVIKKKISKIQTIRQNEDKRENQLKQMDKVIDKKIKSDNSIPGDAKIDPSKPKS